MTAEAVAKLNRYQKFEKLFPFYMITMTEYTDMIREGVKEENAGITDDKLWSIETISLSAMANAFSLKDKLVDLKEN